MNKMIYCKRCDEYKFEVGFFFLGKIPNVCKECYTHEEYLEEVQPSLTKAMCGLKAKEKSIIIKRMVDDYKRKKREKLLRAV